VTTKTLIAALAGVLFVTSASAQTTETWTGPDESRRGYLFGHALDNFETAITEVCFPFLLQNAEANTWIQNYRTYISWRPDTGVFAGLTTYQVGGSSAASAGVGDRGVGRECTVEPDNRMNPDEALTLVQSLIARMPLQMTPSAAPFAPGAFERRLTWCSPADGRQIAALVSVGAADRRRGSPAMFVTFLETSERGPRCDVIAN
jgi:hypothetical protein